MNTSIVRWYDKRWFVRFLEILPGALSWSALITPVVMSFFYPVAVAYFIIAFDLYWTIKSFRMSYYLVRGYGRLHRAQKIDWQGRLLWFNDPEAYLRDINAEIAAAKTAKPEKGRLSRLKDDREALRKLVANKLSLKDPRNIYQAVIIATSGESRDIIEPSVKALYEADYPMDRMILIIGYEQRGGEALRDTVNDLIAQYGSGFAAAKGVMHPDGLVGELIGKGANISYSGRELTKMVTDMNIDPSDVVVTTLDSDHRASKSYFSYLAYEYASTIDRKHRSFQPIPMFYNNIWDVPAAMRVIATSNSFWMLMETMRPWRLRNFASHAQPLDALIETDYWSVTTIVEDGHQFWRSYFRFDGDHKVIPLYIPIYQDAVLAESYLKTIRAQYKQLRRWAWGASDIEFVVRNSIANKKAPLLDKIVQLWRLFEGHFSWATSSIILTSVAWLPLILNREFSYHALAHELPMITSSILQIASVGIVVTILVSIISLPPRPERYKKTKSIFMVLQWVLLPVTTIVFSSFAALDAQTRLLLNKPLGFYVTEKATKK